MAPEKAPAFQFYPKDFLTDEHVELMSNTEVGIYVRLMCFCWIQGTLPLETEALARMARMPLKQFTKLWEKSVLRSCFWVGDDGRLHHARLDKERDKQQAFKDGQRESGKRGATARWAGEERRQSDRGPATSEPTPEPKAAYSEPIPIAHGVAIDLPMGFDGSSSSSASSSAVFGLQTAVREAAPSARSKRPIYQSDRFAVFEWQLDELSKTLGSHFEDFDLHGFFDALTQQSRDRGLVIPSDREARWAWLQAQVEAEAQRRGMPMATAVAAPTNKRIDALMRGGEQFLKRSTA